MARSYQLEIFDVRFRRESAGWVLRIVVDTPSHPPSQSFGEVPPAFAGTPRTAADGDTPAGLDEAGRSRACRDEAAQPRSRAPADASVTIQDCERVSRDVSAILDVEEMIDHHYILEVSSPGLDRPLRSPTDYRRFAGRLVKIVVSEPVDGQKHFEGRLQGLEGNAVVIDTTPGKRQMLPLSLITRARLEVEF